MNISFDDLRGRPSSRFTLLLLFSFFAVFSAPLWADTFESENYEFGSIETLRQEGDVRWVIFPNLYGGYNDLGRGYEGYKNLGNVGLDIIVRRMPGAMEELSRWKDNLMLRLSLDYFPLQGPEANNNLTEDLYGGTVSLIYKFQSLTKKESKQWIPFLGAGLGSYMDVLTLDTPASGKVTGKYTYFGLNGSLGICFPESLGFRFVPEIRRHTIKVPNSAWTSNITYQLGIVFWPREKRR